MSSAPDWIDIDGQRLEYRWLGPSPDRAATLVLLHEGLGCVRMWRDFPQRLQALTGLGVLVYSRPGHGLSGPPSHPPDVDYMHRQADPILATLIDRLALERLVLIGHSDGGSIATLYAGGHRDPRLLGLATIAAHFFVEPVTLEAIAEARRRFEADADRTDGLRARLRRYHPAQVDAMFLGWADTWLSEAFASWDIRDHLSRVEVPMLAIQGELDEYGSMAQLAAVHASYRGPDVSLSVLEGLHHAPQLERPEAVLEPLRAFCARTAAATNPIRSTRSGQPDLANPIRPVAPRTPAPRREGESG